MYSEFRIILNTLKTLVVFYLTFSKQFSKALLNAILSIIMVSISVPLDLHVRVLYGYFNQKIKTMAKNRLNICLLKIFNFLFE